MKLIGGFLSLFIGASVIMTGCKHLQEPSGKGIDFTVDGIQVPAEATPADVSIRTEDIIELNAYVNRMPGPGRPPHPLIASFQISVPTPCHFPVLVRSDDKGLKNYRVYLTYSVLPGMCAQVISTKEVRYEDRSFYGAFDTFVLVLPNGQEISTEITETH